MQKVQATLSRGAIVQHRYSVVDVLGRGGFSAVYLVRDRRDGRLFALKELIDQDKAERSRFTFECNVLERLNHPALPQVQGVFEENNRAYMLMDYVAGANLEVLRKRQSGSSFALQTVLTIMEPIFSALRYLHSQQPPIIHRDLKPSNIIVPQVDEAVFGEGKNDATPQLATFKGGVKSVLVDFGIAKEYTPDSTTTAIRHCSPGYGAPEQYALGTDLRTDIYGLGATFYALLTGTIPVDALQRATKLGTQGIDPLVPLRDLAPDVPESIANAIQRAMAIGPEQRFDSVDAFWQALHGQVGEERQKVQQGSVSNEAIRPQPVAAIPATPVDNLSQSFPTGRIPSTGDLPVWSGLAGWRGERSAASSRKKWGILVQVVLALLLILAVVLGIKAYMLSAQPMHSTLSATSTSKNAHASKTAMPTTMPTPSPSGVFASVAHPYVGTVHDMLTGVSTSMTMTQVQQNGAVIQGTFSGLHETAPFNGVLDVSKHIFFTVGAISGKAPIFFSGNVRSDGSLVGNFCDVNSAGACVGDYGLWSVEVGE